MRRLAFALVLVCSSGCDLAFGLEDKVAAPDGGPEGAIPYEPCGPFLYSDSYRYAVIANPNTQLDADGNSLPAPWSWDEARAMCRARAMDLAVFNDEHEIGMAAEATWPYWIGQQVDVAGATTVDGCPAITSVASGKQFMPAGSLGCGIVPSANEVDATMCTGDLPKGFETPVVVSAMCETPRPADGGCLGRDPKHARYIQSATPQSFQAARTFCTSQHGHLVVFESQEEWRHVASLVGTDVAHDFWIGAQFTTSAWETENSCPAVFSWVDTPPTTVAPSTCAAGTLLPSTAEDDAGKLTLRGAAITPCNDGATYALCEVE